MNVTDISVSPDPIQTGGDGVFTIHGVNTSGNATRHPAELSKGANGTLLFPGREMNENVLLVSEKPMNKAQQRITEA